MQQRKAVITLHGIRTRGEWQKMLVPELARNDLVPYPLDYGNFSALDLLSSRARGKKLEWLRTQVDAIRSESGDMSPSIVCHSFGTYLVGKLIRDYPGQYFDKVIMVGSILPESFPWQRLLASGQVQWVLNEYGHLDVWPRVAARLVKDAGKAGSVGFSDKSPFLDQRGYEGYSHSTYFAASHFKSRWVPTLTQNRRQFAETLRDMLVQSASFLRISERQISAQVYLRDAYGRIAIDPGLSLRPKSEAVSLDPGRMYASNTPQSMIVDTVLGAMSAPVILLESASNMVIDNEVLPCFDGMEYFLTMPLSTNGAMQPDGVLAISLQSGQQRMVESEVKALASLAAGYKIGL